MLDQRLKIIVVGGGAAGFFAAIRCAELNPEAEVIMLERGKSVLGKVKISGGGRCNVTHACWTPQELVEHYPRGKRELLGPFHQFACGDTVDWFEQRGVQLKIEGDGRMFPVTDDSQTIIDCLWSCAKRAGVQVRTGQRVDGFVFDKNEKCWKIISEEKTILADKLIIATGSNPRIWQQLAKLGHTIIKPVPSLFTFNIKDKRIKNLLGISLPNAHIQIKNSKLEAIGPLLITHWGMSGPAILKLSAWGARELADLKYEFTITVNWINREKKLVTEAIRQLKAENAKKLVVKYAQFDLPARLWQRLVAAANISDDKRWADLNKHQMQALAKQLQSADFQVNGKSTFKEEFVTAGGIDLREVNFKTFESKLLPGLYFAGEVLNIDAITGGFNFQAAWTGGWIAGAAMAGVG
jgi:hypothetical protein